MDTILAVKDNFFSDDDSFSGKQGFNIAVALTAFDNEEEYILDPSIGEVKFRYSEWDVLNDGTIQSSSTEIESHFCSAEEPGLVQGGSS